MSELMKHNPRLWERRGETSGHFLIWCPGCKCGHDIPTPRWGFDGNISSPTFTPSVRLYVTDPETKKETTICHFNVTGGKLVLHGDCQHEMKGQTIEMADIPSEYGF